MSLKLYKIFSTCIVYEYNLLKQVLIVKLSNKAFAIIFPMKNIISKVSIEGLIFSWNLYENSSESDFSNNSIN